MVRSAIPDGQARTEHANPVCDGEEIARKNTDEKMERRREFWQPKRAKPSLRMVEHERGARLNPKVMPAPNGIEELHGPVVTGNEHVLPVIDDVTRGKIGERIGPSTGIGFLFEDQHRDMARNQRHAGGKSAQPAADNHHRFHGVCWIGLSECQERFNHEYLSSWLSQ